jgi:hypothetical protein
VIDENYKVNVAFGMKGKPLIINAPSVGGVASRVASGVNLGSSAVGGAIVGGASGKLGVLLGRKLGIVNFTKPRAKPVGRSAMTVKSPALADEIYMAAQNKAKDISNFKMAQKVGESELKVAKYKERSDALKKELLGAHKKINELKLQKPAPLQRKNLSVKPEFKSEVTPPSTVSIVNLVKYRKTKDEKENVTIENSPILQLNREKKLENIIYQKTQESGVLRMEDLIIKPLDILRNARKESRTKPNIEE